MKSLFRPRSPQQGAKTLPSAAATNNFHLVRLFAAANVMILHAWDWFGVPETKLSSAMAMLPGVPIFFVVSGYLITRSWDRQHDLRAFARNRVLRIYPALWICFFFSVALALLSGFPIHAPAWQIVAWIGAQLTIGQQVTPGFLKDYGTGALNGALWTIPLELQFYMLTPFVFRRLPRKAVFPLIGLFALISMLPMPTLHFGGMQIETVSFFPSYYYMFLIGAAFHFYDDRVRHLVEGKFLLWFVAYLAGGLVVWLLGGTVGTNSPNPVLMPLLAALVISAAYSGRGLSNRLLGETDISYGIYLLHMPIINFLLETGQGSWMLAIILTVTAALLSWYLVERPALRGKRPVPRSTRPGDAEIGPVEPAARNAA
jgi:peptidoglycan/LPS O-acetylase OafA/YrhL